MLLARPEPDSCTGFFSSYSEVGLSYGPCTGVALLLPTSSASSRGFFSSCFFASL